MIRFLVVAAFALLASFASAFAQAGPRDDLYERIVQSRAAFDRVVHMHGDSFMLGYALGFSPNHATPEQRKHPLWSYRSPASTFNSMAPAGIVAAYAGLSGQPNPLHVADVESDLRQRLRQGIIRDGDIVVFEDAGLHHGSPREFLQNWLRLRRPLEDRNITVMFVTTPDRVREPKFGSVSGNLYRYDVPFEGLSHNDATRIAAENHTLIDLAKLVDDAEAEGRKPMLDKIHINVEGQCILVGAIFEAIKIKPTRPCLH